MDQVTKRRIILICMLIASLLLWVYTNYFSKTAEKPKNPSKASVKTVQQANTTNKTVKPNNNIPTPLVPIDTTTSPFAALPTNQGGVALNKVPPVPPIPDGEFPVLAPGSIPRPGSIPIAGILEVKAILYQPGAAGRNIAILDDGSGETMVIEGQSSPWGYISSISENKVILEGKTLTLDYSGMISRNTSSSFSQTPIPSLPTTM